jgi:hypothetical protein
MATTTTNFGWDIPQSTDLVKDGATAIAALGQDIDTAFIDLKGGTTGQVLAKASNTDLDYSWVAQDDSNAIQNAIVDAKGDLISATAADTPARLAVGTNGYVLTADSTTATGLKWAAAAAGGKILQVVQATYSTSTLVASTTYTSSGLTATITPSSASSRIMAIVSQNLYATRDPADRFQGGAQLVRNSTSVWQSAYFIHNRVGSSQTLEGAYNLSIVYVDSPATTSATTYTTYVNTSTTANGGEVRAQYGSSTSTIVLLEIGA